MKKLIIVLVLAAGVHMIGAAHESKIKVEGSGYKKKQKQKAHHTAPYSEGLHRSYVAHHYRHRPKQALASRAL